MDAADSEQVDIGGTFANFMLMQEEHVSMAFKMLSILWNPGKAIFQELKCLYKEVRVFHEKVGFIAHGTTASTDVMLQE